MISEKSYPKVFAWIKRFNEALNAAKAKAPKPINLKGKDAAQSILNAKFVNSEAQVDKSDPLGLQADTEVEVYPTDSGFSHKDKGSLISLNESEGAIQLQNGIKLHFPRTGFRIKAVNASQSKL